MNPPLLDFYHHLPTPFRSLAAAMRGYVLRWRRYGPASAKLVREALERDAWDAGRWQRWQEEQLVRLLRHAAMRVPFYREQWRSRRIAGDRSSFEDLASWPVLEKETVRRNPKAFLAEGHRSYRMYAEHTSGSTGTPLTIWWSRRTTTAWYALVEARIRRWHGLSRDDRWALLGGQPVIPADRTRPPFWVWNPALRQLYLSAHHISAANVEAYVEAIAGRGVLYLFGYASALCALATLAEEAGLSVPPMRLAISNAEPLYPHQREVIRRVFGCPVRNTYGLAELTCAASECSESGLHLWPEVGVVEVLADDASKAVAAGAAGRIVSTGLLNVDMPLVRYQTGDRGALAAADGHCPCGRGLPLLERIEGRLDDEVVTPSGRRLGRLDLVLKADLPIREAQIVQTSLHEIQVRVVPATGFGQRQRRAVERGVRDVLGSEVEVRIVDVDRIPRNAAGKLRFVVSEIAGP